MLLLFTSVLTGQKILHKANKQFDLKHYHEAIDSYKKTLEKYPDNLTAKSNLAEAYRMTNQLPLAEEAYSKIMPEEFVDPIHIRNYGITLMKMAKYNKAHYQFELYKIYNPQDAQHYQLSCEFAHHLYRQNKAFEVELVGVNTPNSDFGVTFLDNNLIFSSFRNDVELSDDAKRSGQKLTGNMLYIADLGDDLRAENVQFLRSGIAQKKNIGPISFSEKSKICAFTRNKIQDGGAHVTGDDSYHSIYVADLDANGSWTNERPFRYNEFGTSTGFPSLAFDGSALYFSSNRVGGFGGYDIYVSYWKEDAWTYPENLGEEINTPGNEITPFYTGEDLYFASDYHHGMGGYDIFHSLVKGGKWTHPENMANGINSPADDYYPAIKAGKDGVFFSSNRLGGRGMDDIYLAVPLEMPDFASLEENFVPNAVILSEMDSNIDTYSSNPIAKVVSNEEAIEIKVLNPVIDDNKDELEKVEIDENEELPMWGFAKPGEEDKLEELPRPLIICDALITESATSISPLTQRKKEVRSINIVISQEPTMLDLYLAEVELEENIIAPQQGIETRTESTIVAQNIIEKAVETAEIEPIPLEEEKEIAQLDVPESYKIPNYEAISANRAPLNLDLSGAKRVALGEILPASNVYFIQLAALSKTTGNVDKFKTLSKYGNLYKVFMTNSTKIKLGYFLDKSEAKSVLKSVQNFGFKDAFITKDDLVSLQIELIVANEGQSNQYTSYSSNTKSTTSVYTQSDNQNSGNTTVTDDFTLNNRARNNSYKIRLASYEDPIWFDIDKAKQLGKIEQWTKGSWTIFILGGYSTHADAESARIMAVNKGFADAEIVIDNNGILERLKQN